MLENITSDELGRALDVSKTDAYCFLKVLVKLGAAVRSGQRPNSAGRGKSISLYTVTEDVGDFLKTAMSDALRTSTVQAPTVLAEPVDPSGDVTEMVESVTPGVVFSAV